ncbi:MAG: hypothetical protein ACI9MC_000691 [Kiritimatiellia bacterium]|jgi:hypothetical protein
MLILLLLSQSYAAPTGYTVSKADTQGCELSLGPANSAGVVPMYADCHWKGATMARYEQVLSDWPGHVNVFSTVIESTVQKTVGDKVLIHQVHKTGGIANREVVLWGTHGQVDGYSRHSWAKAKDPLEPAKGNVVVAFHEGYWQAKVDPAGGIHVIHELYYGPGGSVPSFLVRWFQVGGLETSMKEMRTALNAQ